jgi:hypothetical protein
LEKLVKIEPGTRVRTVHGASVEAVEFIDNPELRLWRCSDGCVYVEDDFVEVLDAPSDVDG